MLLVQVLLKSKYPFLEVDLVPLLGIHLYILLIWDSYLGWACPSQQSLVHVLHTRDIPFFNTYSLGGLIFVSLRQDFESLVGLPFFLLHFHTPKFYCNNETWFCWKPTSPWQSVGHKILEEVCLGSLRWDPLMTNWHVGMTFFTFLLVPVPSCTNHDLTCLNCWNLHFSKI
jgi:hypothetical protein